MVLTTLVSKLSHFQKDKLMLSLSWRPWIVCRSPVCAGREMKGRKGTDGMGLKRGDKVQCVPWTCMKIKFKGKKICISYFG